MVLREWELWHVYSSYLAKGVKALSVAGQRLVRSELTDCVMLSDGQSYWRDGRRVREGWTLFNPSDSDGPSTMYFPDGPSSYAREALYQSVSGDSNTIPLATVILTP